MGEFLPLFLLLLIISPTTASDFLAIRQLNSGGNASISLIDTKDGSTVILSDLTFTFRHPFVDATATNDSSYFVVSFPIDDSKHSSHLWKLDSNLSVENEWIQPPNTMPFFELQYSSLQSALFGITINGTYGRILSRLDISDDIITADFIVSCPFMWYVNASTFDHDNDIYYGLLNNLMDESSSSSSSFQKLMVVNVALGTSIIYDYDPTLSGGLLYYLSFSKDHGLFAMASEFETDSAQLGSLTYGSSTTPRDLDKGKISFSATFDPLLTFDNAIGKYSPSFVTPNGELCSVLGNNENSPQLQCYIINNGQLTQPLDVLPLRQGNAAAVAAWA